VAYFFQSTRRFSMKKRIFKYRVAEKINCRASFVWKNGSFWIRMHDRLGCRNQAEIPAAMKPSAK
jgi:hypothetical protein